MNYTIRYIPGEPRFDVLGVIKLNCVTAVDINDRIYAQAQLGRNEDSFYLRIISFEPKPAQQATLSVVLARQGKILRLSASANGASSAHCDNADLTSSLTAYGVQGEDLQGEYWGVVMLFPLAQLYTLFGIESSELPSFLSGNILREHPAISSVVPLNEMAQFTLM